MIRAVLRDGIFHPVEPMPSSWQDGQPVEVEAAPIDLRDDELDEVIREIERLSRQIGEDDWQRLEAALAEADKQAKGKI